MTTHKPLNTKTLLEINTLIEVPAIRLLYCQLISQALQRMVCPPEERISLNDLVQALPSVGHVTLVVKQVTH